MDTTRLICAAIAVLLGAVLFLRGKSRKTE
jgi:hypothetical protein